jgi:transcriptional regulator with XRE-family HTH domain
MNDYDNQKLNLGQKIRTMREFRQMSQEKLSFECNLHRTYIGDIERGNRDPSLLCLVMIARALGTTVSQLTEGVEESPPSKADKNGGETILAFESNGLPRTQNNRNQNLKGAV